MRAEESLSMQVVEGAGAAPAVAVSRLRVESTAEPVGVDVAAPRLSWIVEAGANGVRQTHYAVRVEEVGDAEGASPAVWELGPVASSATRSVDYAGSPLKANTRYRWRVSVSTSAGEASAWSTFRTGLFIDADWAGAKWIARRGGTVGRISQPAPVMRRSFVLNRPVVSAQLYVAAGGYADVRINGDAPDRGVLAPGFTDYDVCVQYDATEVAELLHCGINTLRVELGRGFYAMLQRNIWGWERAPWHAEPCVRIALLVEHDDGSRTSVVTDEEWRAEDGPIIFDDLYAGESFDFSRRLVGIDDARFDDGPWQPVVTVAGPRGALRHQRQPPIRATDTIHAVSVVRLAPGRFVVEFPRVMAGWVTLTIPARARSKVRVVYAETLRADGSANNDDPADYYEGRFQTGEVTFTAEGQSWSPKFSYYGFRYVELTGWPDEQPPTGDSVVAHCIHTDLRRTGAFSCSEPLLNEIHGIVVDTVLNNAHGIPTDTPTFEKNGWTGDGMVAAELMLMNFDAHEFLAKWTEDIVATARHTGIPRVIAPHGGWPHDWGPTPTWNAAMALVPQWLHLYTGDERSLATHYDVLAEHARLEFRRASSGIATTTLGDWVAPETPPGGGNPEEDLRVTATIFLHAILSAVADAGHLVGRRGESQEFRVLAGQVKQAFLNAFYDASAGVVKGAGEREFRQTHNVLALAFGLIPDSGRQAVADAVANDVVQRDFHLNTGALGTKYLLPVLSRHGHSDVAVRVALQTSFPSWGYWLANGATTTWEHWSIESRSRGHYFLGTVDDWLFHDVAGIRPLVPGYRVFLVSPMLAAPLTSATASIETAMLVVSVGWLQTIDGHEVHVGVPVGATAVVRLPAGHVTILESGGHRLRSYSEPREKSPPQT
ncbi:alpha-L-rhamnosidase [Tessaracoccus oleiagri]|uniref:alpha-L-rhamnosidase n=2 Tax=Tessaracoccus oleiagri TaxID=686624 RepID=A0A1G9KK49_9ACTN|nr:alpha-L-rhamnosidase [Tessaracoccus oleiagri]